MAIMHEKSPQTQHVKLAAGSHSSIDDLTSSSEKPRTRVVRRVADNGSRAAQPPVDALPKDSLGWTLLLAARVLATVHGGRSLAEGLPALADELPATRAAVQEIVYGVLRQFARGPAILGRLMTKPLMHAETQALLQAALYRLETRPDATHTVVDQAVRAAGELAGGVFKGLVNGVLRSFLRQRDTLLQQLAGNDEVRFQHPSWWLARAQRMYPDQWPTMMAAGNGLPPMTLRVNRRHGTRDDYLRRLAEAGLEARAVGVSGAMLATPVPVEQLPGFSLGDVSVQDAGAQRAAELLVPSNGLRVLDACAAPGGKTAHLLELADLDLLALDIDAQRARRVEDNLRRLNLQATVKVADCAIVADWWDGRPFDAILADVPCSASGVVRRHPDIKHLRRESDIRRFAATQAAILDALWPLLQPGGRILYATCSVFAEENGGQIDAFLYRHPDAARMSEEQLLPDAEHDGFYYALLVKRAT